MSSIRKHLNFRRKVKACGRHYWAFAFDIDIKACWMIQDFSIQDKSGGRPTIKINSMKRAQIDHQCCELLQRQALSTKAINRSMLGR